MPITREYKAIAIAVTLVKSYHDYQELIELSTVFLGRDKEKTSIIRPNGATKFDRWREQLIH